MGEIRSRHCTLGKHHRTRSTRSYGPGERRQTASEPGAGRVDDGLAGRVGDSGSGADAERAAESYREWCVPGAGCGGASDPAGED